MTKKISVPSQKLPHKKKIAMVFAGCGAKDGSEITESVTALVALIQNGYDVTMFAPDRPQLHVVDHKKMEEIPNESRNILTEAARIARGKIQAMASLSARDFDGLCFPGGFGAAKNLCNFAIAGIEAQLQPDVKKVLKDFIDEKKPIGALCIAPVLLALAARDFSLSDVHITLGGENDAAKTIQKWNVKHMICQNEEACIDEQHRFVSAPAYMHDDASAYDIWLSAQALVKGFDYLFEKKT